MIENNIFLWNSDLIQITNILRIQNKQTNVYKINLNALYELPCNSNCWVYLVNEILKSEKERITCCPNSFVVVCLYLLSVFRWHVFKTKNLLYFSRKQKELKKDSMTQREREKKRKESLTALCFLQKSIFSNDFLYPSSQLKSASWKRLKHFEMIIFLLININCLWNDMSSLVLKLDLEIKNIIETIMWKMLWSFC